MPGPPTNKVVLCFGVKGQGKSYSIKRSIDALGRHSPVYIWDPNREYTGPQQVDGIRDAVYFRSWQQFLSVAAARQGHIGRVCIQTARDKFVYFCKFVHACGNCTVVLDELHDYVRTKLEQDALSQLLTTSRHRRINIYCAAWRPTDLPTWVRHPADEIRAFNTTEVNDLNWYRPSCGEEFVNRLPHLRPRKCAVWRRGGMGSPVANKRGSNAEDDPPGRRHHRGDDGGRVARSDARQPGPRLKP